MFDRRHAWGLVAMIAASVVSDAAAAQTHEKISADSWTRRMSLAQGAGERAGAPVDGLRARPPTAEPEPRAGRQETLAPAHGAPLDGLRFWASQDGWLSGISGMLTVGLTGGGLIGVGLGHGFGGLAGVPSLLGQLGLAALLLWMVLRVFRRAGAAGLALARSDRRLPRGKLRPAPRLDPTRTPRLKKAVEKPKGKRRPKKKTPPASSERIVSGNGGLEISADDLEEFEWLLNVVQSAYSQENLDRLAGRVTPRIQSYLAEALAVNASRGLISRVQDVRLLNAAVSEATWDEDWDYARVALRFEAREVTMDRITGDVLRGDPTERTDIVEVWTFKRSRHGPEQDWIVAGIRPV